MVAMKKFKAGGLTIAPLSRNVAFVTKKPGGKQPVAPTGSFKVQECYETGEGRVFAYVKRDLVFPEKNVRTGCPRVGSIANVVSYWAIKQSHDKSLINCRKQIKEVSVKIATVVHKISLPLIVNTMAIEEGDEIVVGKDDDDDDDESSNEPPKKQARSAVTPGKAVKGKGKGKRKK